VTGFKWLILLCCFAKFSFAQIDTLSLKHMKPKDLKQLGKHSFQQGDFNSSVTYFEYYFKKQNADPKSELMLAHAYRETRDYKRAEAMYAKAYKSDPAKNITALYYQALMQKTAANYTGAKENLAKFKKTYKGPDKTLKKLAAKEMDLCDSSKLHFTIEKKILVQHLDTNINKVHIEAAPYSIDSNTFIYSSLRTNKKAYVIEGDTNNLLVRKFYLAKKVNSSWKYQGEWNEKLNTPGEDVSNASFTPDGKKMYFTKCKPNWQGKVMCALYYTELGNDNEWSEPVKLESPINDTKSNSTMPAVSIDPTNGNEVVYFISDRKEGSKGGKDIWFFTYNKKKKKYSAPKNAGNTINTIKDELSPFFDNVTRTLYFSSEGWGSIGGLDVYKSTGDSKKWTHAENLGKPINSGADDIYFTISKNRENGFVVSNREGGNALKNCTCCDDIYEYKHMQFIHVNVNGTITEKVDSTSSISSAGSIVELYLKDNKSGEKILITSTTTDAKGNYNFNIEAGNEYQITVKKDGYFNKDTSLSTLDITTSQNINKDVEIHKVTKEPIHIKNVEYEFNRADLTESSKTILDTTIFKLMMEHPKWIIEILSHTDNKGADEYNMKLSQKRAESVITYLAAKGIAKNRLTAKGYGETKPIAPNSNPDGSDNPDGRAHNRRTEFKIIGQLDQEIIVDED